MSETRFARLWWPSQCKSAMVDVWIANFIHLDGLWRTLDGQDDEQDNEFVQTSVFFKCVLNTTAGVEHSVLNVWKGHLFYRIFLGDFHCDFWGLESWNLQPWAAAISHPVTFWWFGFQDARNFGISQNRIIKFHYGIYGICHEAPVGSVRKCDALLSRTSEMTVAAKDFQAAKALLLAACAATGALSG